MVLQSSSSGHPWYCRCLAFCTSFSPVEWLQWNEGMLWGQSFDSFFSPGPLIGRRVSRGSSTLHQSGTPAVWHPCSATCWLHGEVWPATAVLYDHLLFFLLLQNARLTMMSSCAMTTIARRHTNGRTHTSTHLLNMANLTFFCPFPPAATRSWTQLVDESTSWSSLGLNHLFSSIKHYYNFIFSAFWVCVNLWFYLHPWWMSVCLRFIFWATSVLFPED